MIIKDKKSALLYAQMPEHKALVNKTKGFTRWALERVENPYVACSFGKDSAVMLHLILQIKSDISVRFVRWKNETEFLDNYDEVIGLWKKNYHIQLNQIELERLSFSEKVEERKRLNTEEHDSYFIGFRKEESTGRRITLRSMGMFAVVGGKVRISPLADWSESDIWAYIYKNNLPTLKSYLHGNERTTSRVPREDMGIRSLSLQNLKYRDLESFQKLQQHFPEVKNYI